MKYCLLFLSILLLPMGCTQKVRKEKISMYQELIYENWNLLEAKELNKMANEDSSFDLPEELRRDLVGSNLVSKGYLLSFFPDSSYNLILDYEAELGFWNYFPGDIIKFGKNTLSVEGIDEGYSHKIMWGTISNGKSKIQVKFESEIDELKNPQLNPFHPANNQWRIRSDTSESYEAIRARLTNYLLHNALIFKHADQHDKSTISFERSKGILRIYKRGIGIISENLMHKPWMDCFYSENEAMNAYYLFDTYLDNKIYKGNRHNQNWVLENYLILLQLFDDISTKSKPEKEAFTRKYYSF